MTTSPAARRWSLLALVAGLTSAGVGYGVYTFSNLVLLPRVSCTAEHSVHCESPAEVQLPFEDVTLQTSDGAPLPAWLIAAPGSQKGLVLVHGHGSTRAEGLRFAPSLHAAGFNLVLVDLRRNHGRYASMGFHERKDVAAAVTFLLGPRRLSSVGLFGFSMGAATSVLAMAEDPRIKAGLFSSAYANLRDELAESAWRRYRLPYFPMVGLTLAALDWRADMRVAEVVPEEAIARIAPRPVLLWHCETDLTTDPSHSRRLFSHAGEPKELWIPPCPRHERLWNFAPQEAEARAVRFFSAAL
jgi:alpha-beta hydrolase superfamily lysophospholipase